MALPAALVPDRFQLEAWAVIQRNLFGIALRHNREAYLLGVAKAEAELRIADLRDIRAQGFVLEFEYRSIRSLTSKTYLKVQDTILDGIRQGLGVDDVAAALDRVLEGRVATVDTIARTETNRAANGGRLQGWKQAGFVKQKEAIATLDDRVRPEHLAAHGEVVGVDDTFTLGAAAGLIAPPWEPNCRCTIAPITALTKGVEDGAVTADAEAAQTFADEAGITLQAALCPAHRLGLRGDRVSLAYIKHRIPGLLRAEEAHAAALRAGWLEAKKLYLDMLAEANHHR